MKKRLCAGKWLGAMLLVLLWTKVSCAFVVNHEHTDITQVPEAAINAAKASLHIAYGHTSHGSQVTSGMSGLVGFANGGGRGLTLPDNIFTWNNGGTDGALDLHDYAMGGDVGYFPQWVNNTRNYLGDPDPVTGRGSNAAHADVNVIIWSWCGQVSGYSEQTMIDNYLAPMSQLELEYPGITFVYMTGHTEISADANTKARNQQIRDYCQAQNKVLYDFADIERYNPDGEYFEFVDDTCDYYASAGGAHLGNWATEWQNAHTEDIDWYSCSSAHSQPLNANQKAYAAWWLWARIAGWDGGVATHPLTVVVTGGGSVSSDPGGISCGADCSADFPEHSAVALTASADDDWNFAGWGGDCYGTASCELTMSGEQAVTALFTRKGDLNGDTDLSPADAIIGLQVLVGYSPSVSLDGDTDGDQKITMADVIYLLSHIAGP